MAKLSSLFPPVPKLNGAALLRWYDQKARDLPWRVSPALVRAGRQPDPYRVWLSEIMLQQTGVATVKPYFLNFLSLWPDVSALADAPLDDVLKNWAGLGYYARARNLHACAQRVATGLAGIFPKNSDELRTLPGIGPYTAAAIAAICFGERIAVVDGNVERVVARVFALDRPLSDLKSAITDHVQRAVPARSGDFAQAMMDLGATLCTPRQANCPDCPLQNCCIAHRAGDPLDFPVKLPKKQRPLRFGHAFVMVRNDGSVWLSKRPEKGLLAQMSAVPASEWQGEVRPVAFPLQGEWRPAGGIVHIFTHFRLELEVWRLVGMSDAPPGAGAWYPQGELGEQALPSVFRKILEKAGVSAKKRPPDAGAPGG